MSASRRTFLAIVAAAVAMGGAVVFLGTGGQLPTSLVPLPATPVTISIASSVTKQKWLQAAADSFLATGPRTGDGHPIRIEIAPVLSGDSMLRIAEGSLTPTVWSPGEMAWVEQLDERWARDNPRAITTEPCAPSVLSPVGIAMWRPMAEALGWPGAPVSWQTLITLANDPQGWASLGHPEWGRLRLGHTHPQYSSAGLLFLASVIYATTGKTEGITAADIYAPEVEEALRALAQNTTKYGMVTTDLLTSMADQGPAFLHATSAFEEGTVRFNLERADDLRWPLAFLFPQEGTFWSDHPFCILDGAGWVDPGQTEGARMFRDWLLSDAVQAMAGAHLLRPLDAAVALGPTLTLANGTDPGASPATVPGFAIPSPEVSDAIIDQFLQTKRKATVILVLDVSGSMEGAPIKTATEATATFIDRFAPTDRMGLIQFNDQVTALAEVQPVSAVGERIRSTVLSLQAGGGTNMNEAVCRAAEMVMAEQARDRAAGENRLYGIVLLSDGKDTTGAVSTNRMFQTCLQTGAERDGPKLFVVAFGDATDRDVLNRLADETRGAIFAADTGSIANAYLKISAEQ